MTTHAFLHAELHPNPIAGPLSLIASMILCGLELSGPATAAEIRTEFSLSREACALSLNELFKMGWIDYLS
jgi:hypothetical protein